MAVACAGGKGPHLGCRVGRGWSRPHQRRARKISRPCGEGRRRPDRRARQQRAHPQSSRIFGAPGRRVSGARAVRRFAERPGITISGGPGCGGSEPARKRVTGSLCFTCGCGVPALRKPRKVDRFGALDDLRRH